MSDIISYIWNFTFYALEMPLNFGDFSFSLENVIVFRIILSLIVLYCFKVLMFWANKYYSGD